MESRGSGSVFMLSNALNKNVSNPVVYDFAALDNPGDSDSQPINRI
jgi:hypothetical protein